MTYHPSAICFWSHRPILAQCAKGLRKDVNTWRPGSLGAILKAGDDTAHLSKGRQESTVLQIIRHCPHTKKVTEINLSLSTLWMLFKINSLEALGWPLWIQEGVKPKAHSGLWQKTGIKPCDSVEKRRGKGYTREGDTGLQDNVVLNYFSSGTGSSSDNLGLFSWAGTTPSQKIGEKGVDRWQRNKRP